MASKLNKVINTLAIKGPIYTKDAIKYTYPKLKTFWHYAKIEMRPPTSSEFPKIQNQFQDILSLFKNGQWKNQSIKEAWLNSLVAAEISFWFFVGEIIGRRSFYGYNV
ncbi:unnamed protein product [Gordionus sp. m RMFG-2023]|uniref:ATP synthase subunit g, mitochondrial-like n=1 Tax=Gordionus sp. m RMFG-2023 TaxID=3053472 RepID=UPI0030DFEB31